MFGRMAGPGGGGGVSSEQRQREAAFDFGSHTGTVAVPSLPPPPPMVPPKLFLAAGSGVVSGEEEVAFSPPAELAGDVVVMASPTSTLQAPAGSPTTSAAATAVPFSRRGATTSSPSGGDDRRRGRKSRSQRPWEASPVGVGLAGALNGDADALPPPAATTVLTTGQRIRPRPSSASSSALSSPESSSRCRCALSPREVIEASEDYTRVIACGPSNRRTTHIFDDRVVVVVEDEFLRWCHGCSKDLGQGNDIFMYRGEMAFCSHKCRYREMLLFDEEEEESS